MTRWLRKACWNAFTLWHARDEARLPYRPLEEILTLQNRRVRSIMAHAYETVPYYREVMDQASLRPGDFRTADDLARLPIVTGDQLAQAPERFLSRRYASGHSLEIFSSGTSGRAKGIRYDPAALFMVLAHGHRQRLVLRHLVGRTFGYREMSAIRPTSVSRQLRDFYESYSWVPRKVDFKRGLLPLTELLQDNIVRINAFQPHVLTGYGSYLGALFRHAWTHRLSLFRPRVVLYGADRMPDADRLLIETEFGVPVLSTYQAVEALRLAFQCERQAGFHISVDQVAVRVVDARGAAVGPGSTGEMVISNLTNRATVLLNYRLGDVVTLGGSTCPCGRTLPTLDRIEGRSDDLIVLPNGQVSHALVVLQGLRTVPGVVQLQLIQDDLRRFVLRAVCTDAVDWQRACHRLDAALRAMVGDDVVLKMERVDVIRAEPGGKVRAVISHCRQ
jgi:phenylacetate-CoA ligase